MRCHLQERGGRWGQKRVKSSALAMLGSRCWLDHHQCGDAGLALGYKSQEFLGNLHSGVISIYVDLVEVTQGDCVGRQRRGPE